MKFSYHKTLPISYQFSFVVFSLLTNKTFKLFIPFHNSSFTFRMRFLSVYWYYIYKDIKSGRNTQITDKGDRFIYISPFFILKIICMLNQKVKKGGLFFTDYQYKFTYENFTVKLPTFYKAAIVCRSNKLVETCNSD